MPMPVDPIAQWGNFIALGTVIVSAIGAAIGTFRAASAASKSAQTLGHILGKTEAWSDRLDDHSEEIKENSVRLYRLDIRTAKMKDDITELLRRTLENNKGAGNASSDSS